VGSEHHHAQSLMHSLRAFMHTHFRHSQWSVSQPSSSPCQDESWSCVPPLQHVSPSSHIAPQGVPETARHGSSYVGPFVLLDHLTEGITTLSSVNSLTARRFREATHKGRDAFSGIDVIQAPFRQAAAGFTRVHDAMVLDDHAIQMGSAQWVVPAQTVGCAMRVRAAAP
jgi:hypothetical protein